MITNPHLQELESLNENQPHKQIVYTAEAVQQLSDSLNNIIVCIAFNPD